ncbi:replication-relaxation family protein [Pseudalkalibacillus sp. A8]|uniref:replication-relaxation family protein n=1 Tax=Pseudalkalibacillus sp. A8 TaxID=3382641 RepID=UPI0038B43BC7
MTKKNLLLTQRDYNFFVDLYHMTFLDIEYLKEVIYSSSSLPLIYERTKRLEEEGYIRSYRLPILTMGHQGTSKKAFTLDKKGISEVRQILGWVDFDQRWTERTPLTIHHSLEMAMVKASFQNKQEEFELVDWLNERRGFFKYGNDNGSEVIRPDGVVLLDHPKASKPFSFMLELERSKQMIEVTRNKLQRYNKYCKIQGYQKHIALEVNTPRILFISNKQNEIEGLIRHSKGCDTSHIAGVLYTTYEQIRKDPYGQIFKAKDSKDENQRYHLAEKIIK